MSENKTAVMEPTEIHGTVSPLNFNGNREEWVEYAKRLENYFIANDIILTTPREELFYSMALDQ